MALSDFQKQKLNAIFQTMYDTNHDGVIDANDFADVIQKFKTLHHWGDGPKLEGVKAQVNSVWDGLRKQADKNKDDIVSREEWVSMWEKTLGDVKGGKDFPVWQEEYIKFMFLANDTSGDGNIDKEEFYAVQTLFGKTGDQANAAWQKLTGGAEDALISYNSFHQLWRDYFLSDDKDAKGNWLFGGIN